MKIAVMQPYLFPYIGYFQLINEVDTFIILDNVQYNERSWINRNRILMNGEDLLWSFSVQNDSQATMINESYFTDQFPRECKKFLRTLQISYGRAPFYKQTRKMVEKVFQIMEIKKTNENIAKKIGRNIEYVSRYLGLETSFKFSSTIKTMHCDTPEERIISLCKKMNAEKYINLPGGKSLYDFNTFNKHGIELSFLEPILKKYRQDSNKFIPRLSIIDVLMYNDISKVQKLMEEYVLTNQNRSPHHV